jgi:hypothetical protein
MGSRSTSSLDPERLWRVAESFSAGLRVSVAGSLPEPGPALRGVLPAEPLHAQPRQVGEVHDIVGTFDGVLFLIGPAFVDALRAFGATGWNAIPVDVTGITADLSLLVASGRVGPVLRASENEPIGGFTFGRFLATDWWDGSDVFVPDNQNAILITDELATHLRERRLTNLELEPAGLEALPRGGAG